MTEITMPKLSDSMEEGTILTWLKPDRAQVAEGEELVEIETDKATMAYASPAQGTLVIISPEGTTLPVGAVIATVGAAQLDPEPAAAPAAAKPEAGQPATNAGTSTPATAPVSGDAGATTALRPTPLARRIAAIHGVDLASVVGSGPRGRITRTDAAMAAGIALPERQQPMPARPTVASAPLAESSSVPAAIETDGVVVKLTRLQEVVARRMSEAKATIPEFQVQTEVAMDAALALRAQLKAHSGGPVPSVNDLIVKSSALALREHPLANGSYRDGSFVLHPRVNVGIAVAVEDGLVVPTIVDADTRSLGSIAAEARRLAERVRTGQITPPELSGGTFTVSNLGMFGMTAITPVINAPQAAILGVGTVRSIPAIVDSELVDRQLMTLTLTCDHRILYGADAARFLSTIRELLEAPLRLTL